MAEEAGLDLDHPGIRDTHLHVAPLMVGPDILSQTLSPDTLAAGVVRNNHHSP